MINELKIKCFLRVAEMLSFSDAGRLMYISQQAVSKHISNLEEDIGLPLFTRSRNSVELTPEGLRLYDFFSRMVAEYSALRSNIISQSAQTPMLIRIGYQNWLDFGGAPNRAIASLRDDNPNVQITGEKHSPTTLLSLLAAGELDMILLHERFIPDGPKLLKVPLRYTTMRLGTSPLNPLAVPGTDYRAFCREPLLMDILDGESAQATVHRAIEEAKAYGFSPQKVITVPNRDSIYSAAELGYGVFFDSPKPYLDNSLLYYETDVKQTLYCVWMDGSSNPYLGVLAQLMKSQFSDVLTTT